MRMNSANQLKAKIKNLAKEIGVDTRVLFQPHPLILTCAAEITRSGEHMPLFPCVI